MDRNISTSRRTPLLRPSANPVALRLRWYVRRTLNRLDNPELAAARRLTARLRRDPPDVLWLANSTVLHAAPGDTDQRRLPAMVEDLLAPGISVHVVAGGGYHPELLSTYLRFLAAQPHRPLVVHPLWIRGSFRPWTEHPVYGYREAIRRLQSADPAADGRRPWASIARPGPGAFAEHGRLPCRTLLGDGRVSDYVAPLKRGELDAGERARLIYAYHHGMELIPGSRELRPTMRFGAELRRLGCRAVAYHDPVCIDAGVEALGPRLATLVRSNRRTLEMAYRLGIGSSARVVQLRPDFTPDEFINPADGDEHINQRGRLRLADALAEQIELALRAPARRLPMSARAAA